MGDEVLVPLLVTVVLWNVVKVFSSQHNGTGHLGGNDSASQDTATDGDVTGPWALLVCFVGNDDEDDDGGVERDDASAMVCW